MFKAGETGPEGALDDAIWSWGISRFIELDLEGGAVLLPLPGDGPRLRFEGNWRIRRRPDSPRPCSPVCSGIMGDLRVKLSQLVSTMVPDTFLSHIPNATTPPIFSTPEWT